MKVTIQFSCEGVNVGPPLLLPQDANSKLLTDALHQISPDFADSEYVLVANNRVVGNSIFNDCLKGTGFSLENVILVNCLKTDIFTVKPVTRSCATLSGHQGPVLCCAFSGNSKILATGSGDKTVRLWDTSTMTPIKTLSGHSGYILVVSWSYDGAFLASGDSDGKVIIWDQQGNIQSRLLGHKKWVCALSWEPSLSASRLVSCSKDGTAKVWDAGHGHCIATLAHSECVSSVRWPKLEEIVTGSHDRTIKYWCPDGRLLRTTKPHAHWVNSLSSNFDHSNKLLSLPDIRSKLKLPSDLRMAACSDDFTLTLLGSDPEVPAQKLVGHQGVVNHIAFSPDGALIASASFDKSVKVWCGKTGKFIGNLRGHVGPIYQLAWASDSKLLLTCSKDSTAKVWDVPKLKLKNDLPGHVDEVYCVDWSADGSIAASGGKDQKVMIWKN